MSALNPTPAPNKPLKINGSRICRGDMDASHVEVLGHLHVSGSLTTARLRVRGECSIGLSCNTQELNSFGSLRVAELRGVSITSNGYLSVTGEAAAEEFKAEGCVRIDRLSCIGTIRIKLGALCKIRHMTSEGDIIVSPSSRLLPVPLSPFRKLRCEIIEGADLTLSRTQADLVCGQNVTLGPGCSIREIRYRDTLTIHPLSHIGKIIQMNT